MAPALKVLRILLLVAAAAAAGLLLVQRLLFGSFSAPDKAPGMKSHLSSVRSALQVYYGDHEGFPADDLSSLVTDGKSLPGLPELWSEDGAKYPHPPTRAVQTYRAGEPLRDTGRWAYFNDPADKAGWGNFLIDCTHAQVLEGGWFRPDRAGEVWSVF